MPRTLPWPLRSLRRAVGEVGRDRTQMYAHISGGRHCTLRTMLTPLGILPQGFSPALQLSHQPCAVCVTLEEFSATRSHMRSRKTQSVKKEQRYILYGPIFFQEQKSQAGMLNCQSPVRGKLRHKYSSNCFLCALAVRHKKYQCSRRTCDEVYHTDLDYR